MAIYVGIDGGGTRTRAVAVDTVGRVVGYAEAGGSSPQHTPDAERNSHAAIRSVVENAGCKLADVVGLVAGIAGFDDPSDATWADKQTAMPGLTCARHQVNDAVVAHAGALRSRPGIIAISGTGSIVFGVTESGRYVRNYDFHQWGASAAGSLARDAAYRVLIGDAVPADAEFVQDVLSHWHAASIDDFRTIASNGFMADDTARGYHFGAMGPIVTQAAQFGSPLAQLVCDRGARSLPIGIRLVGLCFAESRVEVALVGSAVRSSYMQGAVEKALSADPNRRFQITDPAFPAEIGAAMMALERSGITLSDGVLANLGKYSLTPTQDPRRSSS